VLRRQNHVLTVFSCLQPFIASLMCSYQTQYQSLLVLRRQNHVLTVFSCLQPFIAFPYGDNMSIWCSYHPKEFTSFSKIGTESRKAFSSFDAMLSIIPILMLVVFVMNLNSYVVHKTAEQTHQQQIFNKLVSIADYTVKSGAVRTSGDIKYPNWIDQTKLSDTYIGDLKSRAALSNLDISLGSPSDFSVCIYRLVVIGDDKQIARIFVCGD